MQTGQAAADRGRGRRGRGPGHPRGQQDPRHLHLRRGQGPRVRRAPQGDAAGHGRPDRRPGHQRGDRPQAGERHGRPARARPPGDRHQGRHDHRRGCRLPEDVKGRIAQIKREIEDTDSDWDREKLQERLAKLAGGVAVVKVGAATEVELKEKKHRIEDALSATRAAVEEGIVAGGGTALVRARSGQRDGQTLEGDEATGARIVARALEEPLRWIAFNAGLEGAVLVARSRRPRATPGSTPSRASWRTWSRPASSTRPRSPGPPCRTRPRSRRCCSPPRRSWPTSPRSATPLPRPPPWPAAWVGWAAWAG